MFSKDFRSRFIDIGDYGDCYKIRCLFFKKEISKKYMFYNPLPIYDNIDFGSRCKCLISVDGFRFSGSGAVSDLLREFDSTSVNGTFDIESGESYRPMFGDESFLYNRLSLVDFEQFLHVENTPPRDDILLDWTIKQKLYVINELIQDYARYEIYHYVNIEEEWNKFFDRTFKVFKYEMYDFYSFQDYINLDIFQANAREFFQNTIWNIPSKDCLVMDQFLRGVYDLDVHFAYLGHKDKVKQIKVFRDPRDQFVLNSRDYSTRFYDKYGLLKSGDNFIKFLLEKERIRECLTPHPNRLMIRFEDLVNDYENSIAKVCDFLGIDKSHHINKGKYFMPEVSRKNIGIYKNYHDQRVMDKIKEELGEYCYE